MNPVNNPFDMQAIRVLLFVTFLGLLLLPSPLKAAHIPLLPMCAPISFGMGDDNPGVGEFTLMKGQDLLDSIALVNSSQAHDLRREIYVDDLFGDEQNKMPDREGNSHRD